MYDSKLEERKNNYKKVNYDPLEAREKHKLTLRKQKIDALILERREISSSSLFYDNSDKKNYEIDLQQLNIDQETIDKKYNTAEDLIFHVKLLITKNEDFDYIKFGVNLLRKCLSMSKDIPVQYLLDLGICDILINFIEKYSYDLSYEILWCFSNISCLENTDKLNIFIRDNYIKTYMMIFNTYQKDIVILEQLIWHLGNILYSEEIVIAVISRNIFKTVYDLISNIRVNEKIVKISLWFMANIIKFKIFSDPKVLEQCVQTFLLYLKTNDEEMINDILWGLSYASETEIKEVIDYMISQKLCEYIFSLNLHARENLILPIIRIAGNLSSNDCKITESLIEQGCLSFLDRYICNRSCQVRREALWAISNLLAGGTHSQISRIMQSNLHLKIFSLIEDVDYEVTVEAIWAIGNLIDGSSLENLVKLTEANIIDPIIYILGNFMDSQILMLAINALTRFFEHGKNTKSNQFVKIFVKKGGMDVIENLNYHKSDKISSLISLLLDKYLTAYDSNIDSSSL